MEKFVQLISGGLEMRDSSLATSHARSVRLSSSAALFPLAEYAFSGLEFRQGGKGKGRTLLF